MKSSGNKDAMVYPVWVPEIDRKKPMMTFALPKEVKDYCPHKLSEYMALGFSNAYLNNEQKIVLEKNLADMKPETEGDLKAIIDHARNFIAVLGLNLSSLVTADAVEAIEKEKSPQSTWELFIFLRSKIYNSILKGDMQEETPQSTHEEVDDFIKLETKTFEELQKEAREILEHVLDRLA